MNKSNPKIEREMFASRFRRELNSLTSAINHPKKALQRVVIKSRRSGEAVAVMISPGAYYADISYLKAHQKNLNENTE